MKNWILEKWDWWIYRRSYNTMKRMAKRNIGFTYLMELHLREYNSRNPIPEPDAITITNHPQWMKATIAVNNDYTLKAGIAIHFPSRERLKSIMLVQDFAVRHSVKIGYNPNYGEKHLCSIVDGEDILLTQAFDVE